MFMKKPKNSKPVDRHDRRLDLTALVLLLAGLLVAMSVFTDEPAPSSNGSFRYGQVPHRNVLGPGGAWLSQILNETLGLAVHVMLISWFVLVVLLFLRRGILA